MKKIKLLVIMDPIEKINIAKDTTFAMLLEAQQRLYSVYYATSHDIYLSQADIFVDAYSLTVREDPEKWFTLHKRATHPTSDFHLILMRKDPPFNMDYIYTTYLLELAEKKGVLVINKPASLRDANEKLFTSWFPECCPPTLVASKMDLLKQFAHTYQDIIIKPLDEMGGASILRLKTDDPNLTVGIELLTQLGKKHIMAQQYIPEIQQGDKRILLIHGKPIPYALARLPKPGETRANLVAGGQGHVQKLSEHDKWICEQVGDTLLEKGLLFVGLDVIGDYLTEINVTSPTCAREIEKETQINIMQHFFDGLEVFL